MIRRLLLEGWRAYERLDLTLEAGTTFIVARNGVGKTSLIEGAAWALYGEAAGRPCEAVRRGRDSAVATVEVDLGDGRTLVVRRPLPKRLTKNSRTEAQASVNDVSLSDDQLAELLRTELGADAAFLARLTMLRGLHHGLADETSLSLDDNLMRVFGIDGLQRVLAELGDRKKSLARQIRSTRQTIPPSAARRAALSEQAQRLAEVADTAEAHYRAAALAETSANRAAEAAAAMAAWRRRDSERHQAVLALAASTGHVVAAALGETNFMAAGGLGPNQDLASALLAELDAAEVAITSKVDRARVRHAIIDDRLRGLQDAMAVLEAAGGWCPTCRRPLEPQEVRKAIQDHRTESAELQGEVEASPLEPEIDALSAIRAAKTQALSLQPQAPPHEATDVAVDEAAAGVERAAAATREALDVLIAARTAAASADNALVVAQEEEQADATLTELYRQQGLLEAATAATAAAVEGLMSETVAPLANELASRWKMLFEDRGELILRSGAVSRTVNGLPLPLSAFSDGEQTSAQLLLRLLVLDAATRAGFCWIDEPLEHLDPSARRHVGSLLARARSNSGLRQVVVTTYEEPLARRLALRHPGETRVVYVRQDHSIPRAE